MGRRNADRNDFQLPTRGVATGENRECGVVGRGLNCRYWTRNRLNFQGSRGGGVRRVSREGFVPTLLVKCEFKV